MVLTTTCKRQTSFLIAAISMKRFLVGFLARLAASIPVSRPADYAVRGIGTISIGLDNPEKVRIFVRN